eukprot:290525_1
MKNTMSMAHMLTAFWIIIIKVSAQSESLPYAFKNPNKLPPLFNTTSNGMYEYGAHLITFSDGQEAIFYCANIHSYEIRDHILYRTRKNNNTKFSSPNVALAPYNNDINQSTEWDAVHVCDPRILSGTFKYVNNSITTTYKYAMFYTGTDCYTQNYPHNGCVGSSHNQIGVVYAQNQTSIINGDWIRLTKTPLIKSNGTYTQWGVGQPSATSVNGDNLLLLFYTVSYPLNHIIVNEINLEFILQPIIMKTMNVITNGLQDIGTSNAIIFNNAKFAFINGVNMFLMIREQHPYPNDFISQQLQIAVTNESSIWNEKGYWYIIGEISPILTGYDRNHNAGFCTSVYGTINNDIMKLLYSTATAMPNFNNELWTYLVHQLNVQFCIDQKHCNPIRT